VEIFLGLAVVVGALGVAFWRSLKQRKQLEAELDHEPKKRMSKREKKLAEIRSNDPDPEIPTIDDLINEELAETGVNDITGSEGLTDPVKLKVYHRDSAGLNGVPPDELFFRLSYGIEAPDATVDDVRLVHDAEAATKTSAPDPKTHDESASAKESEEASESGV